MLRRLGYTNSDDAVQLKGRAACEVPPPTKQQPRDVTHGSGGT